MLRIRFELIPDGDESRTRQLASAELGNITAAGDVSDYKIMACEGDNSVASTPTWESHGPIARHGSRASAWVLVSKAAAWAAAEAEKR